MKLIASTVALGALRPSPLNARPTEHSAEDVADIVASIRTVGLINPLTVHALTKPKGKYGVLAGGRRLRALLELASDPAIDAAAIPVVIADGDTTELRQLSIFENESRADMSEPELLRAFRDMMKGNPKISDEQLAVAFGMPVAAVRRILRLAALHPDILNAYGQGHMSGEMARAYAASPDQAEQLRAFKHIATLPSYGQSAHAVRHFYGYSSGYQWRDQLAFVGEDAFTAAGGKIVSDLFSDDRKIEGDDILERLFDEKVQTLTATFLENNPNVTVVTLEEIPRGQYDGADWDLRINEGETRDPADQTEHDAADMRINEITEILEEAIAWDTITDEFDPENLDELQANRKDKSVDLTPLFNERLALEQKLVEIDARPKVRQEGPLNATIDLRRGAFEVTLWWPSREAAGLPPIERRQTMDAAMKAKRTNETGVDQDITDRARDEIRRARANMIGRHLFMDAESSATDRAAAADGFVYATARQLFTDRPDRFGFIKGDRAYGFAHMFAGARWVNTAKCDAFTPDLSDIPGFEAAGEGGEFDVVAGFWRYNMNATPDQKAQVGAACFYARVEGTTHHQRTMVNAIVASLSIPRIARRAWSPSVEFFGLFKKQKLLNWLGEIGSQFAIDAGKKKKGDLDQHLRFFMTADDASVKRYGMQNKSADKAKEWLPPWLRFQRVADEIGNPPAIADHPVDDAGEFDPDAETPTATPVSEADAEEDARRRAEAIAAARGESDDTTLEGDELARVE